MSDRISELKANVRTRTRYSFFIQAHSLGLFTRTLSTRIRLRVTAALCLLFALLLGVGVGFHLYEIDPLLVIVVVTVVLFTVITSAYLLALVLGDCFWGKAWRELMRDGRALLDRGEEIRVVSHNGLFLAFFVAFLLVMMAGIHVATLGQYGEYLRIGATLNMLASRDDVYVSEALNNLANPLSAHLWQEPKIVAATLAVARRDEISRDEGGRDASLSLRSLAIYCLGRMQALDAEALLEEVLFDVEEDISLRRSAAISLGRLRTLSARRSLLKLIGKLNAEDAMQGKLLFDAYYALSIDIDAKISKRLHRVASDKIRRCMSVKCDLNALGGAFYALKAASQRGSHCVALDMYQMALSQGAEDARSLAVLCMSADALRQCACREDHEALRRVFSQTSKTLVCPAVWQKIRGETGVSIIDEEPLNAKLLRAVGNLNFDADYDWIWLIGDDKRQPAETRRVAEGYTRLMIERKKQARQQQ